MVEIKGNFWEQQNCDALVCTTNCIKKSNGELVMGAGIAKDFAIRYSFLPKLWGNQVGNPHLMAYFHEGVYLIACPTKVHWKDPSPFNLVVESARQLQVFCKALNLKKVLLTRLGCGHGGLNWNEVKIALDRILDDRFCVISNI